MEQPIHTSLGSFFNMTGAENIFVFKNATNAKEKIQSMTIARASPKNNYSQIDRKEYQFKRLDKEFTTLQLIRKYY
jgi:hypothetical protein